MKTNLDHLSIHRRRQLQVLIPVIIKAAQPEKLILYGVYGTDDVDVFSSGGSIPFLPSGYDLLVITRRGDRRQDHEIQDIIENRCRMHATVTVLVHDIDHVNQRLLEGQYFFSLLSGEGVLLYDAGNVPLSPARVPDLVRIRHTAEKDFKRWSHQARAFFDSALFNLHRKEYRLTIFLLHQAAEHIYQAILLAFMGYKPCTHNLDKLRRWTHRFSIEMALLFPRDEVGVDLLFRLFVLSYVDSS
jgi:hypothetical protein